MHRPVIKTLPLLLLISLNLYGQSDSTRTEIFSGRIVNDSLAFGLSSVHIWNESTRMGTISGDSGEFRIRAGDQDTIVFSMVGYLSKVIVVSSYLNQIVVRFKQKPYEIGEVVVRRFRSYESFKYQVLHLDLPESEIAQMKENIGITAAAVALEADRERAIEDKLETGRIGYITPLGKGVNKEKAFREKMSALEKRKRIIHAKFNRELVGDITKLEGDELTEFIAFCAFSEDYLYEADLYSIIDSLYAKLEDYNRTSPVIK